ncbi:MAG: class I SAM-dependent methyltransferase [Myxococcota bacterium]
MRRPPLAWLVLGGLLALSCKPDAAPKSTEAKAAASGFYLGRRIASTMSHHGAPWLTRAERDAEENTTLLHQQLGLRPGDTACDFGAGNGYHTQRMAEAVGPSGEVLAIDIQPKMLALLQRRMRPLGLENVRPVLAKPDDASLPDGACDLILMVDVYHELNTPARTLSQLRRALRTEGLIALVEFREEDPAVPIKPLHKMSKAQIMKEFTANELSLRRSFDGLPWQHLMFFGPEARR